MIKPIVAIDVDDVLAHSIEAFRLKINQKAGVNLTAEHYLVPGEYHKYLDRVLAANGVDYDGLKDELFADMSRDQSHIQPHPGAAEILHRLSRHYDFVVITARDLEWQEQTSVWMKKHFPNTFKEIHFAGNRHDPAKKTKGDMCLEAGATYLIDDNPEHALDASAKGVKVVLFGSYGWHTNVPEDMVRCRTWQEVEAYFDAERS
jgi:5'(3')-deoxyribonucleotidase